MNEKEQPILIITGMHRSGTSLTSSLLASAGLDIGKNLLEAGEGNPKGHFENIEFLDFHQNVLSSLGIDKIGWTSQNKLTPPPYFFAQAQQLIERNKSLTQPWGWKEPRTTLFLDFWANLMPSARFLFIVRCPWEVVDSIYRRGDVIFHQNPHLAIQSWDSYNQAILSFYERNAGRCLIYNLNQIIIEPQSLINKIREKLNITLSQIDESIYEKELLKQDISRSFERPWLIKNYFPLTLEIYQRLNQLANYEDPVISQLAKTPNPDLWSLQDWLNIHLLKRRLKGEITHLEQVYQELGQVKGNLAEVENELQVSAQEKITLQQKLTNDLQESRHHHQRLIEKLTDDLQESHHHHQQLIQQLTNDLQELRHHHQQLILDSEQLKQERDSLETNLSEIEHKFAKSQAEIEQLQFKINQLNSLVESSQIYAQDIENKYNNLHNHLKNLEQESSQKQSHLEQILQQEQQSKIIAQERVMAMETSKFWKLRKKWFKLKRALGMGENE